MSVQYIQYNKIQNNKTIQCKQASGRLFQRRGPSTLNVLVLNSKRSVSEDLSDLDRILQKHSGASPLNHFNTDKMIIKSVLKLSGNQGGESVAF